MQKSLQQLAMRMEELDRSLMDPSVASDGKKLREITKERATLEPIVQLWTQLEDSK
jgi:peptide chain release factor 1